jgi:hypothetical protein
MIGRPFQLGKSGNPGGRPKVLGEFQEIARKHTIEAIDVLIQIMLNEKAPPNARVAAANTLLDATGPDKRVRSAKSLPRPYYVVTTQSCPLDSAS